MRGWKDRILASAMLIVLVAAFAFAYTQPRMTEEFTPEDYRVLAANFPGGTYVPNQDPRYYRVCIEGVWQRLYADGSWWNSGLQCWK